MSKLTFKDSYQGISAENDYYFKHFYTLFWENDSGKALNLEIKIIASYHAHHSSNLKKLGFTRKAS